MPSSKEIQLAKKEIMQNADIFHEHDDCIRIALEWLDAQKKIKHPNKQLNFPLKHLIEHWAGRYVSQTDVEVAAHLHPEIFGTYPYYNISTRLIEPSTNRLKKIKEAFTQDYREDHNTENYALVEILNE